MKVSWFTALRIQNEGKVDWSDEQRFMYQTLSVMIADYNEDMLKHKHCERENVLVGLQSKLRSATYFCHYQYGGFFFCYGNMNPSAFRRSSQAYNEGQIQDDNSDWEYIVPSLKYKSSASDLDICVDIECPLDLAPIKYLEKYENPDPETRYNMMIKSLSENDSEPTFKLSMHIFCRTSLENRLPHMFTWEISSQDFDKRNTFSFKCDDYVEKSERFAS